MVYSEFTKKLFCIGDPIATGRKPIEDRHVQRVSDNNDIFVNDRLGV